MRLGALELLMESGCWPPQRSVYLASENLRSGRSRVSPISACAKGEVLRWYWMYCHVHAELFIASVYRRPSLLYTTKMILNTSQTDLRGCELVDPEDVQTKQKHALLWHVFRAQVRLALGNM
eukprot:2360223-Amphidinium_carterae.1